MYNDLANFETITIAAPAAYKIFTFHDLYMHRAKGKKDANQATLLDSDRMEIRTNHHSGRGTMAVHWWEVYDGHSPGATLVARARGLHIDTSGAEFFFNTFTFVFEHGRFKGSTLQAMGVAPMAEDEYSIVGGSGMFAMANGVVRRIVHKREAKLEIDKLTIKGFIPIFNETAIEAASSSVVRRFT